MNVVDGLKFWLNYVCEVIGYLVWVDDCVGEIEIYGIECLVDF